MHRSYVFIALTHFDGLVQERRNSIAYALELRLSCTNLSICSLPYGPLSSPRGAYTGSFTTDIYRGRHQAFGLHAHRACGSRKLRALQKFFLCPANIITSPIKLLYTAGKISMCPDGKCSYQSVRRF